MYSIHRSSEKCAVCRWSLQMPHEKILSSKKENFKMLSDWIGTKERKSIHFSNKLWIYLIISFSAMHVYFVRNTSFDDFSYLVYHLPFEIVFRTKCYARISASIVFQCKRRLFRNVKHRETSKSVQSFLRVYKLYQSKNLRRVRVEALFCLLLFLRSLSEAAVDGLICWNWTPCGKIKHLEL